MRLPVVFVLCALHGGCYDAVPPSGTQKCSPTRKCSSGYLCVADLCYKSDELPDLGKSDRSGDMVAADQRPAPDLVAPDLAVPDLATPDLTLFPDLSVLDLIPPPDTACVDVQTDPNNCGTCGHSCLGGTCASGKCSWVVLATTSVSNLAVYGGNVFWTSEGTSCVVYKLPTSGGSPTCIVAGSAAGYGMAVGSGGVFWSEWTGSAGRLMKAGFAGENPTMLTSTAAVIDPIVIDSANVYWLAGGIFQVSQSGGMVTTLSTDQGERLATDGSYVYWFMRADGVLDHHIKRTPVGSTSATVLASNVALLSGFATFGSDLFAIAYGGSVSKFDTTTGSEQPLTGASYYGIDIAVDASGVYWTTDPAANHSVFRVDLTGGAITSVAVGTTPQNVALDATAVYWSDGGSLRKKAK